MHANEAAWLAARMAGIDPRRLSPVLEIGSSTRDYREVRQPWIHALLIAPLRERGIRVVHSDVRAGEGVDVRADIFDDAGFARLEAVGARSVLCCNMVEHVRAPGTLARRIVALVPPGGYLFVTAPRSYPRHNDPIDTMFRPTPEELIALFDGVAVVDRQIIAVGSYRDHLAARPWLVFRHITRFPFPFVDFGKWKRSMTKLRWLYRPFLQTCIVLRKEAAPRSRGVRRAS